jgi:hypothetical protein
MENMRYIARIFEKPSGNFRSDFRKPATNPRKKHKIIGDVKLNITKSQLFKKASL